VTLSIRGSADFQKCFPVFNILEKVSTWRLMWKVLLVVLYLPVWVLYVIYGKWEFIPKLPLDPIRVCKIDLILMGMILDYLFGPPIQVARVHLKLWWNRDKLIVHRNIAFGSLHAGTRLDVYPAALNGKDGKGRPVIVFVYGGGWGTGRKSIYSPIGVQLSSQGFVVVIPDYTIWPSGTVSDMVQDTDCALNWVLENIQKYGGDPTNVTVIAHSAGAHLTALSLISHSINCTKAHKTKKQNQQLLHKLRGVIL
jgi:hypothetical protein